MYFLQSGTNIAMVGGYKVGVMALTGTDSVKTPRKGQNGTNDEEVLS